jgi:hypothetical protein
VESRSDSTRHCIQSTRCTFLCTTVSQVDTVLNFSVLKGFESSRIVHMKQLYQGGHIGIYSGNVENIFKDMQLLNPTSVSGAPR